MRAGAAAREVFDASVDELDAATLSRLNRSRQQALAAAKGRNRAGRGGRPGRPWARSLPACWPRHCCCARRPRRGAPGAGRRDSDERRRPAGPLELLAAGEDLDLATEADLEFYAWVEIETADDGVG